MICKKCNESGVLNEVMNQWFYYCRTCKEEIPLELAPGPVAFIQPGGNNDSSHWDFSWLKGSKQDDGLSFAAAVALGIENESKPYTLISFDYDSLGVLPPYDAEEDQKMLNQLVDNNLDALRYMFGPKNGTKK